MGKPIVNLEAKKIKYKNIEYEIVGADSKNICIVGENTALNQYIIHWTKRVKKIEKRLVIWLVKPIQQCLIFELCLPNQSFSQRLQRSIDRKGTQSPKLLLLPQQHL